MLHFETYTLTSAQILRVVRTFGLVLIAFAAYTHAEDTEEEQEASSQALKIQYFRPGVGETERGKFINFANTPRDFLKLHKQVILTVCDNVIEYDTKRTPTFVWEFEDRLVTYLEQQQSSQAQRGVPSTEQVRVYKQNVPRLNSVRSKACEIEWFAPREGSYFVKVNMQVGSNVLASGYRVIDVRDLWFVVIGDSYMSGQGNPDRESSLLPLRLPSWIDAVCFQSSLSHSFLTYEQIEKEYTDYGLLFTYLACSGAGVYQGFRTSHVRKDPQIEVLKSIQEKLQSSCPCDNCCKTIPDALLMGIGANDLEFEGIVSASLVGNIDPEIRQLPIRMDRLDKSLDWLATEFSALSIPSDRIFYTEYFDPVRNQDGNRDASCPGLGLTTLDDFIKIDQKFRVALNDLIRRKCQQYGWNYLDGIDEAYRTHGVCSRDPYIRSLSESFTQQGNVVGAFHPNVKGHQVVSEITWPQISPKLADTLNAYNNDVRKAWNDRFTSPRTRRG